MTHASFAERVLAWYQAHGRKDLPWQKNPTPYRVWISEVMLQQTQVATVVPYFQRFMASFPDVAALANAKIDDVLHHWSGLGYYARARNLHKTAVLIHQDFSGEFPSDIERIVALPGIGRSTAGAILALSNNQRHAILDGNVKRVLARFHAVDGYPGTSSVAKKLWEHAQDHTPRERVAEYTQAIMDLGATVCTRTKPDCGSCPVVIDCAAHASGKISEYPGKRVATRKPLRKTHMALIHEGGAIYLERRPSRGIWGGLWSFPEPGSADELAAWCESQIGASPVEIERWEIVRHSFTHFDLEIAPIAMRVQRSSSRVEDRDDRVWYDMDSPQKLGIAAPVSGLIQKMKEMRSHVPNG